MVWFLVARALFVLAVMYAAVLTRPFSPALHLNIGLGLCLGLLMVAGGNAAAFCRSHRPARRAGRRRHRPRPRQDDRRRAVLGRQHRPPRRLPPQLHPAGVPVSRDRHGGAERRVARAGAAGGPLPRRRAAEALPHSRHQRDHRRPDCRPLRDRVPRRHARHPAVRAQGAAARRRFLRLAQAQPRPARARHPAEDPEDVRRGRHDLRHRLSRRSARSISSSSSSDARCRGRSSPTTST